MTGRQWRYALSMMPHIVPASAGPPKLYLYGAQTQSLRWLSQKMDGLLVT